MVATITGHKEQQMRDDILATISYVPGVIEALALRFSQIAIGYGDSNEPFAPGTTGQSRHDQCRRPRMVAAQRPAQRRRICPLRSM